MGKEDRFDQKVYDILGVDDSTVYTYESPDGRQVQLYVGFYKSQREGDLIHSRNIACRGPAGISSRHPRKS